MPFQNKSVTTTVFGALLSICFLMTAGAPLASASDGDGALPTVKFQALPADPAAVPLLVMKEKKLDRKHGFNAELMTVDPDVAAQTFLLGESDIATEQDVKDVAIARQEGHDTVVFYPVLSLATGIVVPKDSPVKSPKDLIGKKVGHFGIDSGTTTGIAAALITSDDHINPYKDYKLVQAGPQALPTLLKQGRVDAIFDYQPLLAIAVAETPGRYLFSPYKFWTKYFDGYSPRLTYLAAREDWLREHEELAINIRDAWAEAQSLIIKSNYTLLHEEPYASHLNLPSEKVLNEYIRYCQEIAPCYADGWTAEQRGKAMQYVKIMMDNNLLVEKMPKEPVAVRLEDFFASDAR